MANEQVEHFNKTEVVDGLRVLKGHVGATMRDLIDAAIGLISDPSPAEPSAAKASALPDGWVPLTISWDGDPEEVAYGPQIMMDRLKKWLDRYYGFVLAERASSADAAIALSAQPSPDAAQGDWIDANDVKRLVRELDVALNGEGAATQASLCDIVAQVKSGHWRLVPAQGSEHGGEVPMEFVREMLGAWPKIGQAHPRTATHCIRDIAQRAIEWDRQNRAPQPVQGGAESVADEETIKEIAVQIVRDVCETDPADPEHHETLAIKCDSLQSIIEQVLEERFKQSRQSPRAEGKLTKLIVDDGENARPYEAAEMQQLIDRLWAAWSSTCSEDATEDGTHLCSELNDGWDLYEAVLVLRGVVRTLSHSSKGDEHGN